MSEQTKRVPRTERLTIPLRPTELELIESEASALDVPAATLLREIAMRELRTRQMRRLRTEKKATHISMMAADIAKAQPDMRTMISEATEPEVKP